MADLKTDIHITYCALNSWYLDTSDHTVNTDYLNDAIIMWGRNTKCFMDNIKNNNRMKIESIVFAIFMDLVNDHIKTNEYPYNQNLRCNSYQLKKWLNEFGNGYDELSKAVETFKIQREEAKKGNRY